MLLPNLLSAESNSFLSKEMTATSRSPFIECIFILLTLSGDRAEVILAALPAGLVKEKYLLDAIATSTSSSFNEAPCM